MMLISFRNLVKVGIFLAITLSIEGQDTDNFLVENRNILKTHIVMGVPNIARFGASYHRILAASGNIAFTLGFDGNLGVAIGDVGTGTRKIGVSEKYGNCGILPGIHIRSSENWIFSLNGIFGIRSATTTIGDPKFLTSGETLDYKVTSNQVSEVSFQAGLEAGIYYLFTSAFIGFELGAVGTPGVTIPYIITDTGGATPGNYPMPEVRYSGLRISVTIGFFF